MTAFCVPIAFSGSTNVVAPPNVNPMNGLTCQSAATGAGASQPQGNCQPPRAHYRTKRFKNSLANGDSVTSPLAGEYSFTRPSLFAIKINVRPRAGNVIINDEDASSDMPNCHTTFSPL